jgi:hypothetical protein
LESVKIEIRFNLLFIVVIGLIIPPAFFPSEKSLVIEGARVLGSDGLFRAPCRVVIANGKIMDVGPQVPSPAGAILIDGRNKWLIPGLIDVFICPTALAKEPPEKSDHFTPRDKIIDVLDPEKYPARNARVWEIMKIHKEKFTEALKAGVTTLLVIPDRTKVVSGPAGVVKVKPFFRGDSVLSDSWALRIGFERKSLEGLESHMGIVSGIREVLSAEPTVLPVLFETNTEEETALALSLQEEFRLRAVFYGKIDTPSAIAEIARKKIPVILPSPAPSEADEFIRQLKNMLDSNVESTFYSNGNRLNPLKAVVAIKPWLQAVNIPESRVYDLVCAAPARILGLSRRLGGIEKGMDADLVLWDGDPLQPLSKPEKVFIDGDLVYESGGKKRAGK